MIGKGSGPATTLGYWILFFGTPCNCCLVLENCNACKVNHVFLVRVWISYKLWSSWTNLHNRFDFISLKASVSFVVFFQPEDKIVYGKQTKQQNLICCNSGHTIKQISTNTGTRTDAKTVQEPILLKTTNNAAVTYNCF